MSDNFFTDNADLQRALEQIDLREVVDILEDGYGYKDAYPDAPRSYEDALDNYRQMLTVVGDICATRIAPIASEAAEEGAHIEGSRVVYAAATREALDVLRQAEVMGSLLPREYGGLNLPETVFQMTVEMVSRAEAGLMTIFGLQEISETIYLAGDDELKARLLPRFSRGEVTAAMVLTEPDAGSDLGAVHTTAVRDEASDTWRLNGVKRFITNGNADVLLVLARSEEGSTDARGLSLYAVEADDTVVIRRLENKMGLRTSPTCEIEFRNTPAVLLGRQRFGLIRHAMGMMSGARLAVAAQSLGIAEAASRAAEGYAWRREQFGRPIAELPAVHRMLISMRSQVEGTRALLYEASAWVDIKRALERRKERGAAEPEDRDRLKRADRMATLMTALVKFQASEMANRVAYEAIQVHGGSGYMREYDVERYYRDVRVTSIYEGTSQLQVVAAIGPLLGHTLTDRLRDWESVDYGPDLVDLRSQVEQATAWLEEAVATMAEADRALVDYYSVDLVELAGHVVMAWLLLGQARDGGRKRELARVHLAGTMPKMRAWYDAVRALDSAPLDAKALAGE